MSTSTSPMTLPLQDRIARGEGLHTEFKAWPIRPDDLAATIVAFANSDGGQLLLGVSDDGRLEGLQRSELDQALQFVDNVSFNNCEPPVTVLQETTALDDRVIVAVNIPKGDARPCRTNRGVHYIRTSSGRRQASREELLRLLQASGSHFHDESPVMASSLADIDRQALHDMLAAIAQTGVPVPGIPEDRLLSNWGLTRNVGGEERPTVAGMLLLGQSPQRFLPHAYVSALRIADTDIATPPNDQRRIEGRLFDVLQDCLRFLDFNLFRRHEIRGIESEVVLEFPMEVQREVLVNALAHRDYTVSGPIRLIVFEDRVEVRTPGRLPNSVRTEQLGTGVHVLRNPTLYNLLFKRGLGTDAGSGIPRMIQLLREHNGNEPSFKMVGNEFVVTLTRQPVDMEVRPRSRAGGPSSG